MREPITALRREMKRRGIFAYLVTTEDFHGSEYVGEHFKSREYLSGFTGSAGRLVVTENEAALWTDGRYFIQAEAELAGSGITLMKQGEQGVPSVEKFLAEKLPNSSVLGFDGRCVNALFARKIQAALAGKNIALETELDLVGEIRNDRPPLSKKPVFVLPDEVCGLSRGEKLAKLREEMREQGAKVLALSALDDIAWTLNLRGGDVDYNPVFLAFMLIFEDTAELFAESTVIDDEIKLTLENDGVKLQPYGEIYNALNALSEAVWIDTRTANFTLRNSLKSAKVIAKPSPAEMLKACKTPAEISAEKAAHIKDGAAVTRFIKWMKSAVKREEVTEISAAEKLEEFRRQDTDYLGQSFEPIMAFGEHGAIVHYSATSETNAVIEPRGLLLSDTGGHYLLGTTDITRTIVLSELSDEEKRAYTLALAAHLELLGAVFPKGARGSTLDAIARKPLWDNGLDFNHGTGHGVGFLLNVHEGPQRISYRAANDAPLCEGMITSNEPGLYFEGKFGVRHESLVLCEKAEFEGFLRFSPLTCVPFDLDGIDKRYLTEPQTARLNAYHKWVYETLSPMLSEEERGWLAEVTKPI
ncbi:MAG: aminopeptidase P family protein [Oscillospiraceae bacterium]|nr:aminopeptidase P family protein [Oscillospiraceae bacterium]